jgi:hypothetical protein
MVQQIDDLKWGLPITNESNRIATDYARWSLPFTYNRMGYNQTPKNLISRLRNIANGKNVEVVLREWLNSNTNCVVEIDESPFYSEDKFDMTINGVETDSKSFFVYDDVTGAGNDRRLPISPQHLIENKDYNGREWPRFFPMLIPFDQYRNRKEITIFSMVQTRYPGGAETNDGSGEWLAGIHNDNFKENGEIGVSPSLYYMGPYSPQSRIGNALWTARREAGAGFEIELSLRGTLPLGTDFLTITVNGLNPDQVRYQCTLAAGETRTVGPLMAICSFDMDEAQVLGGGQWEWVIRPGQQHFDDAVWNGLRNVNFNEPPQCDVVLKSIHFGNMHLVDSQLHIIGWIGAEQFREAMLEHNSYLFPQREIDPLLNTPWVRITDDDIQRMRPLGIENLITEALSIGEPINCGILKGGMSIGACCYFYPSPKGLRSSNSYVLVGDLNPIDSV